MYQQESKQLPFCNETALFVTDRKIIAVCFTICVINIYQTNTSWKAANHRRIISTGWRSSSIEIDLADRGTDEI
jgi:hypothetical protein